MDLASALELPNEISLDTATSLSFNALKTLHLSKVKLLVSSIDALQLKLKEATKEGAKSN
jgi:hypothetical protein